MTEKFMKNFKMLICLAMTVAMVLSMTCVSALAEGGQYKAGDIFEVSGTEYMQYSQGEYPLPELSGKLYWSAPAVETAYICGKEEGEDGHKHSEECMEITKVKWTVFEKDTNGDTYTCDKNVIVSFVKDGKSVEASEITNPSVSVYYYTEDGNVHSTTTYDTTDDSTYDSNYDEDGNKIMGYRFVGLEPNSYISDGYYTERTKIKKVEITYTYDGKTSTSTISNYEDLYKGYEKCLLKTSNQCGLHFIVEVQPADYYYKIKATYYTGDSTTADYSPEGEVLSTTDATFTPDPEHTIDAYKLDEAASNYKSVDLSASKNNKNNPVTINIVYRRAVYNANYEFVSATTGKELPEDVMSQLPDSVKTPDGESVRAAAGFKPVEVKNAKGTTEGTWTFTGWDSEEKTVTGADVTFTGKWEYTAAAEVKPTVTPTATVTPTGTLTVTPTASAATKVTTTSASNVPTTGDSTNAVPFAAAMLIAAAGVVLVVKRRSSAL